MVKILIVDDDPKHRESLGDVVDSFGYGVQGAANLDEALAALAKDALPGLGDTPERPVDPARVRRRQWPRQG